MKFDELKDKIIVFLLTAAIGAGAAAYVKLERLEARLDALKLDEMVEMTHENHTNQAVMTAELRAIKDGLGDLKELLRDDSN